MKKIKKLNSTWIVFLLAVQWNLEIEKKYESNKMNLLVKLDVKNINCINWNEKNKLLFQPDIKKWKFWWNWKGQQKGNSTCGSTVFSTGHPRQYSLAPAMLVCADRTRRGRFIAVWPQMRGWTVAKIYTPVPSFFSPLSSISTISPSKPSPFSSSPFFTSHPVE